MVDKEGSIKENEILKKKNILFGFISFFYIISSLFQIRPLSYYPLYSS